MLNRVQIIGYLGADPETKTFPSGGSITTIRVATTEKWTDKQSGEKKEATEWHTIEFSNRLAEIAEQYLTKGSLVYVEGKLHTRSWDDQQTGKKRYMTTIRGQEMKMLGGRPSGQQGQQGQSGGYQQQRQQQGGAPNEYAHQSGGSAAYGRGNNSNGGSYQKPQQAAPQPAPIPAELMDDDIPF